MAGIGNLFKKAGSLLRRDKALVSDIAPGAENVFKQKLNLQQLEDRAVPGVGGILDNVDGLYRESHHAGAMDALVKVSHDQGSQLRQMDRAAALKSKHAPHIHEAVEVAPASIEKAGTTPVDPAKPDSWVEKVKDEPQLGGIYVG